MPISAPRRTPFRGANALPAEHLKELESWEESKHDDGASAWGRVPQPAVYAADLDCQPFAAWRTPGTKTTSFLKAADDSEQAEPQFDPAGIAALAAGFGCRSSHVAPLLGRFVPPSAVRLREAAAEAAANVRQVADKLTAEREERELPLSKRLAAAQAEGLDGADSADPELFRSALTGVRQGLFGAQAKAGSRWQAAAQPKLARPTKDFSTEEQEAARGGLDVDGGYREVMAASATTTNSHAGSASDAHPSRRARGRQLYRVINDGEEVDPGVVHCLSKQLDDTDEAGDYVPWGSTVLGVDEGDGWLRVGGAGSRLGGRFLPMTALEPVPEEPERLEPEAGDWRAWLAEAERAHKAQEQAQRLAEQAWEAQAPEVRRTAQEPPPVAETSLSAASAAGAGASGEEGQGAESCPLCDQITFGSTRPNRGGGHTYGFGCRRARAAKRRT